MKCAICKSPATKKVLWADGRAYQPSCDGHVQAVKDMLTAKNGKMTELAGVQDLKETALDGFTQDLITPTLLEALVSELAGREITPGDAASTEKLMAYWAEGEGAAKIGWGTAGDFYRCESHLEKYVGPEVVKGLCANLHKRATGASPGHAAGESGETMTNQIQETVSLSERAAESIAKSGRMIVRAIDVGVGSTGYYSPEVLEEAARNRLIRKGTPMHLDHPSATEWSDRPERSVQTIAAVFTGDATYNPATRALEGEVQVFKPWRERLAEMAPYIGCSIQGSATDIVPGVHEGKAVSVVEGLHSINSVDFVTRAGRGGQVLAVLESHRPTEEEQGSAALTSAILDQFGPALTEAGITIVRGAEAPGTSGTIPDNWNASGSSESDPLHNEENSMSQIQIDEAAHRDLVERAGRVSVLETERDAAVQRAETAEGERDTARTELQEAQNTIASSLRATVVSRILNESATAASATLDEFQIAGISGQVVHSEDGSVDEAKTRTAFDTAIAKITEAHGAGRVRGLGGPVGGGLKEDEITEAYLNDLDTAVFGDATSQPAGLMNQEA